jgi:hypothetical protein
VPNSIYASDECSGAHRFDIRNVELKWRWSISDTKALLMEKITISIQLR